MDKPREWDVTCDTYWKDAYHHFNEYIENHSSRKETKIADRNRSLYLTTNEYVFFLSSSSSSSSFVPHSRARACFSSIDVATNQTCNNDVDIVAYVILLISSFEYPIRKHEHKVHRHKYCRSSSTRRFFFRSREKRTSFKSEDWLICRREKKASLPLEMTSTSIERNPSDIYLVDYFIYCPLLCEKEGQVSSMNLNILSFSKQF